MNQTGVKTALDHTRAMVAGTKKFLPQQIDDRWSANEIRKQYVVTAEPLGTVSDLLLDKLGERLAFERGGVRLYDALINKCEALPDTLPLALLKEIRNDELQHFLLVQDTILKLGGDPTQQSPCADAVGVSTMGFMQVLNDPRTTMAQCLDVILSVELTDNAGWDLLIKLMQEADVTEDLDKFTNAKENEETHLANIRALVEQNTLKQGALSH